MSDDFTYRGKTVEELQEMNLEQFSELLNSDARRKIRRGLNDGEKKLLNDLEESGSAQTHERDMIVVPSMIDTTVEVYNGQRFVEVDIEPEMLGHKLGELAKTRKKVEHSAPGLGATRSSQHVPLK
jgi:small subunit ribosomal protein S19